MTDQDRTNEQCCCLVIRGGRLSGKTLAIAMQLFLAGGRRVYKSATTHKGKQTIKQLAKDGAKLENIETKDGNTRAFKRIARKYGLKYAVKKDVSEVPPKYLVFFKSRDIDSMTAAFNEFCTKQREKSKEKPSIRETFQKMQEKVKNQVLEQVRHKDRGLDR